MNYLDRYIDRNLSINFFSIFLPLFVIASVIFLIRVSTITSVIKIDFFEMLKLYLFIIPDLLFYTIPLSFFIGGVLTFSKLSFDYEMVVLFSLGVPPRFFLWKLFKLATLFTLLLFFLSMVMIPHTKQMYKEFTKYKKQEAIINLKTTEFGQTFGKWSIFIKDIDTNSSGKTYRDIALFYKDKEVEKFILAKKASFNLKNFNVQLKLHSGSVLTYSPSGIKKIFFKQMVINDPSSIDGYHYRNTLEYFRYSLNTPKRRVKLITNLFLSTFPIMSIFLILAIGIQNVRYSRSFTNFLIGISIFLFYALAFSLSKSLDFGIFNILILWLLSTYWIYRKFVMARY